MIVSGGKILGIHEVAHDRTFSGDGVKHPLGLDHGLLEEIQKTSAKLDKSAFESWSAQTEHWDITQYTGGDGIKVDGHEISVSGDYAKKSDIPGLVDYVGGYGIEVRDEVIPGENPKSEVHFIFSGASSQYPVSGNGTIADPFGIYKEVVDRWNDVSSKFDASGMSAYAQSAWVEEHFQPKFNLDDYYKKTETSGKQELADEFAKYQLKGDYMPADALNDLSGKWDGAYDTVHENSAAWNEVSSFHNTRVHSSNGSIGVQSGTDEHGNTVFDLSVDKINIPDIFGYNGVAAEFSQENQRYEVCLSGSLPGMVDLTSSGKTIDITSSGAGHFNLEVGRDSCQHFLGQSGPVVEVPGNPERIGAGVPLPIPGFTTGKKEYVGDFIKRIEDNKYIKLKPGLYLVECSIRFEQSKNDLSNDLGQLLIYTGNSNADEAMAYERDVSGPDANKGNRHTIHVTFVRKVVPPGTETEIYTSDQVHFALGSDVDLEWAQIQDLYIVKLDSVIGSQGSGGIAEVTHDVTMQGAGTINSPLSIASAYDSLKEMIDAKPDNFLQGPGILYEDKTISLLAASGIKFDTSSSAAYVGITSGLKYAPDGSVMTNISSGLSFNSAGQMVAEVGYGLTYSAGKIIIDDEVETVVDIVNRLKRDLDSKLTTNFPYPMITETDFDFTNYYTQSTNGDFCICQLFSVPLNHKITEDTRLSVCMKDNGYGTTKVILGIFEYNFNYWDEEHQVWRGQTNWVCDTGPISLHKNNTSDKLEFPVTHINPEFNELRSDRAYYAAIAFPRQHNSKLDLACADGYNFPVHGEPILNWRWQSVQGLDFDSPNGSFANTNWWLSGYEEQPDMKRFFLQIRNEVRD